MRGQKRNIKEGNGELKKEEEKEEKGTGRGRKRKRRKEKGIKRGRYVVKEEMGKGWERTVGGKGREEGK